MGILRVKLAVKLFVIAWTMMKNKKMFAYAVCRTFRNENIQESSC